MVLRLLLKSFFGTMSVQRYTQVYAIAKSNEKKSLAVTAQMDRMNHFLRAFLLRYYFTSSAQKDRRQQSMEQAAVVVISSHLI